MTSCSTACSSAHCSICRCCDLPRRPGVLRGRHSLVRHALRARQRDHRPADGRLGAGDGRTDAAGAGGPAGPTHRPGVRRGARQGHSRASRRRASGARSHPAHAILRHRRRDAPVPVPAGRARPVERNARSLPGVARRRGRRARVGRRPRRPRRRRPARLPREQPVRPTQPGLARLRRRRARRARRAARVTHRADRAAGLRGSRPARPRPPVRPCGRRRESTSTRRTGRRARGPPRTVLACGQALLLTRARP